MSLTRARADINRLKVLKQFDDLPPAKPNETPSQAAQRRYHERLFNGGKK